MTNIDSNVFFHKMHEFIYPISILYKYLSWNSAKTSLTGFKEILIIIFFIFCYLSDSYSLQRFAEYPTYTEVNPGQDALLTCKIIDKRGTCSWQKDNKVNKLSFFL